MNNPDAYSSDEQQPLRQFAERAYLDYAMYVILDRALPRIQDGLKPVQRRIVYAMSELGLSAAAKFKKSARTVGDVLGKFHPHGDTACYEAMVHMAQPFTYRYPLVDGQGNWGSLDDPKSFAAMRYTEARLTAFADLLLRELGQGTVDWGPNFDGTLEEPKVLPARLPNLLLNGSTGIAVGMATDILPHNLREVVAACVRLLEVPEATVSDLCEHIAGPDFPTGGELISPREDLLQIYQSGQGTLKLRAAYEREKEAIVITELPYQISSARIMEQIAAQMRAKKLPWLDDLRDESDHENPVRIVLTPRSARVDVQRLMSHLFATTDLERNYRLNFNVIGLDGRPRVMSLRDLLGEWLAFRRQTVRRRLQFRLQQVLDRLHVLEGLLIAFLNIDEVIRIIRYEEDPKAELMDRFALSERQAEAILNLRLRHLARLEEFKIRGERDELEQERQTLEAILASEQRLTRLIRDELLADAEAFGDARRTRLVESEAARALAEAELTGSEPVTVVLSEMGWIRAAKGHDVEAERLSYKTGDQYFDSCRTRTDLPLVILDSSGRAYSLKTHSLPSARGQGEPLSGRLDTDARVSFRAIISGSEQDNYCLAASNGYGFMTAFGEMISKNRSGKALLTLAGPAEVVRPVRIDNPREDRLALASSDGHLLIIAADELPVLARGKGNKLISIPTDRFARGEEVLVAMVRLPAGARLTVYAGKRHFTLKTEDMENFQGARGRRGALLPRGLRKVTALEAAGLDA